jgi:hypothetical protein
LFYTLATPPVLHVHSSAAAATTFKVKLLVCTQVTAGALIAAGAAGVKCKLLLLASGRIETGTPPKQAAKLMGLCELTIQHHSVL